MPDFDQMNRTLSIDTPLGPGAAVLIELDGIEALSQPFLFTATMSIPGKSEGEIRTLLGQAVTLFMGPDESRKPIHGKIRRLSRFIENEDDGFVWRAEVVPALWFLSCNADCRIFQNVSVPDVLDEVFKDHGVQFVDKRLASTYPVMKYCVQYRETALDFVSRLMEEVGIFYWHEHIENKHTLVLADMNAKAPMMDPDSLEYGRKNVFNGLTRYELDFEFRTGAWSLRDYNFKTPTNKLDTKTPTRLDVAGMASNERYDYPGRYQTSGRGRDLSRIRMEAEEARHHQIGGGGRSHLSAGVRVKINYSDLDESELCLVTEVHHKARDTSFWSRKESAVVEYSNEFKTIPADVPYRPERRTPRPIVQGPHTAVVTGPAGSEIHTDTWGRVVVRFHWDRDPDGTPDERCSCWVRVSQGWAGKGWGMMHIPRVGHEVIVEFLEGDPDRPVITGRVYNGDNMPPWALPANKTQSGIKSNSTLGGGGWNEFRFEDKKGSEEVYFQAQKDLNSLIKNDETREVGHDRTTKIKHDDTLQITNNLTTDVGVNKATTVGANFEETIGGSETRIVGGSISETVTGSETRVIGGSIMQTVTGGTTHVDAGSVTVVGATGINLVSPAAINIASGTAVTITAPAQAQVAPSWLQTGANTGTIYANQMQVAMNLLNMAGNQINIVGNSLAITNTLIALTAIKMDNCMLDLSSGPIYIRKAGVIVKA